LPFSQSTMTDDAHPPKNSGGPQAFFERKPHVEGVFFGYLWWALRKVFCCKNMQKPFLLQAT